MSQGQQSTARAQPSAGSETVEDPSVQAPRRSGATVSVPRIIAGALAAASGAFASSWLGLAGTVTGAIVVSVIVSVGTAVYTPPVERSHQVIQRGSRMVLETLPVPPHNRGSTYVGDELVATQAIPAEPDRSGDPPDHATSTTDGSSYATSEPPAIEPAGQGDDLPPTHGRGASLRGRFAWSDVPRHWRRIVATTAVLLVAGFALLTGFELAVGRSAESITGGGSGGTTLGHLVPGNAGNAPATKPSRPTPTRPTGSSLSPSTSAPSTTVPTTTTPSTSVPSSTTPSSAPPSTTAPSTISTP